MSKIHWEHFSVAKPKNDVDWSKQDRALTEESARKTRCRRAIEEFEEQKQLKSEFDYL